MRARYFESRVSRFSVLCNVQSKLCHILINFGFSFYLLEKNWEKSSTGRDNQTKIKKIILKWYVDAIRRSLTVIIWREDLGRTRIKANRLIQLRDDGMDTVWIREKNSRELSFPWFYLKYQFLWTTLCKTYVIDLTSLKLIQRYLTNRKQRESLHWF